MPPLKISRSFTGGRRAALPLILATSALATLTVSSSSALSSSAYAANATSTQPHDFWLSLGFSTLDDSPAPWATIRSQIGTAALLQKLTQTKGRQVRVIVPIFNGGQAFFATRTAPFAARNPHAEQDAVALQEFIRQAHQRKVQVFLGVNALSWSYPAQGHQPGEPTSIFEAAPEYEELNKDFDSPLLGAHFASPWNEKVHSALVGVVGEAATRFPEADGMVLDVHLSRSDVTGFSAAARLAAKQQIGIDPANLAIQGTADEKLTPDQTRFVQWRDDSLTHFQESLIQAWKASRPRGGAVWQCGVANYGAVKGFDALRSGQDWAAWANGAGVTGTLLEGRWSEGDSAHLEALTSGPKSVVPVAVPTVVESDIATQWAYVSTRVPPPFGVDASSPAGINETIAFLQGKRATLGQRSIEVGKSSPDFEFVKRDGSSWNSRSIRGQKSLFMLVEGKGGVSAKNWAELEHTLDDDANILALQGALPLSISRNTNPLEGFQNVVALRDGSDQISSPAPVSLIVVDRDGWVRDNRPITGTRALHALISGFRDPTPSLEVGQPAPDFWMTDMNGNVRHLAGLRGRKALILSFFPKCFTGGCANHMASLNTKLSTFDKNDIDVLGVSIDAADVQRDFAERWNLHFPLVPDTGRALCFLYGAAPDTEALATRQTVFIDKEGIVRWIDRNVQVTTHGEDVVNQLQHLGFIK